MAEGGGENQDKDYEIEGLAATYGGDFAIVDENDKIYEIRVYDEKDDWWAATIQFMLPPGYPATEQPAYEVHCEWMSAEEMDQAVGQINEVCAESIGERMVHRMVDVLKDFVKDKAERNRLQDAHEHRRLEQRYGNKKNPKRPDAPSTRMNLEEPVIYSSQSLKDKKSTFQAYAAHVVTEEQATSTVQRIKSMKKVDHATHIVEAYRIFCEDTGKCIEDNKDGGEDGAGPKLLRLLEHMDVKNVVVVVPRWHGGIMMGPDRFKYINACAKEVLETNGFVEDEHHKENKKHPKGKKKSKKGK